MPLTCVRPAEHGMISLCAQHCACSTLCTFLMSWEKICTEENGESLSLLRFPIFFITYRGNPQPKAIGHTQTRLQSESGAGTMHRRYFQLQCVLAIEALRYLKMNLGHV